MPNYTHLAGNMRSALERLHVAWSVYESRDEVAAFNLRMAFRFQLVALCQLHHMDEIVAGNDCEKLHALVERLLSADAQKFEEWLDRFEHNGELACKGWLQPRRSHE